MRTGQRGSWIGTGFCLLLVLAGRGHAGGEFRGRYFAGRGDVESIELLDIARRMFAPDPEFQNVPMLYTPAWNGLVEGPTWDAWWIQNSYGPSYCIMPFLEEPLITFLQNSQDLWFDQMGDGKRAGYKDWVAPDGCLCDAARPGWVVYKQGDGRIDIHDWGLEFTAAGLLLQAELLLIRRDPSATARYLSRLERCADFIETRRDPESNLFLAGPAANLLAPSYAGWSRPDGTYGRAYLAGLSITYIAALDRLIELEKLAGNPSKAALYTHRRGLARKGLPLLATEEGYFIKSLDPDGTRHGVYGAERFGYFESPPNHDAIAFRVVDDAQAGRIYDKIASIPGLRPHAFILPNYPSLDDMYTKAEGLWAFGTWVNGGHWSTCEARMILAYYRLGKYEDARRSMGQLLRFARRFRMDNPLVKCGSDVYQPNEPINLCYDSFGPPAALIRGLFEYLYGAEKLELRPHIPPGIEALEQRFPVRFGRKRIYLRTVGSGSVTAVRINGEEWKGFNADSILLPHDKMPDTARIIIALGGAQPEADRETPPGEGPAGSVADADARPGAPARPAGEVPPELKLLDGRASRLRALADRLAGEGLGEGYVAAHARLAAESVATIHERRRGLAAGEIKELPEPSRSAAEQAYLQAASRLCDGLEKVLATYEGAEDPRRRAIHRLWVETGGHPVGGSRQ